MTKSLCPAPERRQALHMMLEKDADAGGDGSGDDGAGGDDDGDGGDENDDHVADGSNDDDHDGSADEDDDHVADDSSDDDHDDAEERARVVTLLSLFVSAAALGPGFALSGSC